MERREFGVVVREGRVRKGVSLRRLANLSGIDYSRLSRIETGTRPAPDLASIRALAGILDLDLGELLVASGTSRSVVEDLVWSERVRLGRAVPDLGAYRPGRRASRRGIRSTATWRSATAPCAWCASGTSSSGLSRSQKHRGFAWLSRRRRYGWRRRRLAA